VLVLFVLFLFVLLGASAIAIDYANWVLIDRRLQNVADHVVLAGASAFTERDPAAVFTCAANPDKCHTALEQAWSAFSQDLDLGLGPGQLDCLADAGNTPNGGWDNASDAGCGNHPFGHTLWVSTPPPGTSTYTNLGGRYPRMYGIVFARIDEATRSFLGGVFGIAPGDRTGWATAGALPSDFALEVFCRIATDPNCNHTDGLTIHGQGGIRLLRGDIGSNESLFISAVTGSGVILKAGNMFLVNGDCPPGGVGKWACPEVPADTGGIANDDPRATPNVAVGLSALPMAPLPVPRYANPLGDGTTTAITATSSPTCAGATASAPCVPARPASPLNGSRGSLPGDWTCGTAGATDPYCGVPTLLGPGNVRCDADTGAGDTDGLPPMIPPGYYRSIEVRAGKCAILDPTAENSGGLYAYQRPGIYRFGGDGPPNRRKLQVNSGSYLIGDGVTLVFDANWPDAGSNQGIAVSSGSALALNTMRVPGQPPCTNDTETATLNMSTPLGLLPFSASRAEPTRPTLPSIPEQRRGRTAPLRSPARWTATITTPTNRPIRMLRSTAASRSISMRATRGRLRRTATATRCRDPATAASRSVA
jgi:hypothetical protein